MNINKVGTGTYGPLESSTSVQNVGRKIKFEHRAVEPFSAAKRLGKHESHFPAPAKRVRRFDCLGCVPDCIRQVSNLTRL